MVSTLFCGLKLQKLVSGTPPKMFRCPYFWEEGGGQEGYQNVLIFYVLIKGGGRGSKQIKTMSLSVHFFFWKASLMLSATFFLPCTMWSIKTR